MQGILLDWLKFYMIMKIANRKYIFIKFFVITIICILSLTGCKNNKEKGKIFSSISECEDNFKLAEKRILELRNENGDLRKKLSGASILIKLCSDKKLLLELSCDSLRKEKDIWKIRFKKLYEAYDSNNIRCNKIIESFAELKSVNSKTTQENKALKNLIDDLVKYSRGLEKNYDTCISMTNTIRLTPDSVLLKILNK